VHVIIAGCGRVGSQLAMDLSSAGHAVVVIDKEPTAFRKLDKDFGGRTLTGIVFDRDVLEAAGARRAQAFVAVTSGDNSNIVSARVAKERFGVEQAIARIYDPDRAVIYERLGVTTVASARWTAEAVMRAILPESERVEGAIGPDSDVVFVTLPLGPNVHAVSAKHLNRPGEYVLAAITRQGSTSVPVSGALLEAGDRVHLSARRDALDSVRQLVAGLGQDAH
jgi:trk system potassium uptake protein TrkA